MPCAGGLLTAGYIPGDIWGVPCAGGLLTAGLYLEDVRRVSERTACLQRVRFPKTFGGVPCAGGTKREREGETSDFKRQSDSPSLSLLDIPTLPFVPRLGRACALKYFGVDRDIAS